MSEAQKRTLRDQMDLDEVLRVSPRNDAGPDSGHTSVPDLPSELIDLIFTYLIASPNTLRACAFVCRAWFPAVQRIFLSFSVESLAALSALPHGDYTFTFHPHSVCLLLAKRAWFSRRTPAVGTEDEEPTIDSWAAQLVEISSKLRALEELTIARFLHGWHIFPPWHPFFLVKRLHIEWMTLEVPAIYDFLSRFPYLETLILEDVVWRTPSSIPDRVQHAPSEQFSSKLRTLVLIGTGDHNPVNVARLIELLTQPGFPKFHNLRFEPDYTQSSMVEVTEYLGPSLRQLQLCHIDLRYPLNFLLPRSSSLVRIDILGSRVSEQLTYGFESIRRILFSLPNPEIFRELRLSLLRVHPESVGLSAMKILDEALSNRQFTQFELLGIRYTVSDRFISKDPRPQIELALRQAFRECHQRGVLRLAFDAASFRPEPFSEF